MKGPFSFVFLRPYAGSPYFQFLAPKSPGCQGDQLGMVGYGPVMACVGHSVGKMMINRWIFGYIISGWW